MGGEDGYGEESLREDSRERKAPPNHDETDAYSCEKSWMSKQR